MDASKHQEAKEAASVSRKFMNAIRELEGKDGVALRDVKKYLRDVKKMNLKETSEHIKQAIKRNMQKGVLVRVDGLYKVNDSQGPVKRQTSQAKASDKAPAKKVRKMAKTASPGKAVKSAGKRPRVAKAKVQVAEAPELPTNDSAASGDPMQSQASS